jgi:hypothetical protein
VTVAAWHAYAARCGGPIAAEADEPATLFAPEIERYCELIRGVKPPALGLMTKGSGESFTARARQLLRAWDMPDAGVAHLDALAERFEHTNAFLKLRRLLAVADALGLEPAAVERLAELHGRLLPIGREATAFVSIACTDAAFVPGIKIDYPQVDRATCLELVPALLRDKIGADVELLCAAAGVDALSYVGVRCPAEGALGVKLYADVAPDFPRVSGSPTNPAG